MRLYNIRNRLIYKNTNKYIIDWTKPSRSKFQSQVKSFLNEIWSIYIVYEEFPVYGSRLSIDFYNASQNLAIEVQGSQHTKYNPFFHGNNRMAFLDQIKRDEKKKTFCELNNIKLIEIFEEDRKKIDISFLKNLLYE